MRRAAAMLLLLLPACGDAPETGPAHWETCTLTGVRNAGGLALHRDDLLVVCRDDDRDLYALAVPSLEPGAAMRVDVVKRQVNEDALLMGAEPFALEGYKIEHLWAQKLDFCALAVQPPHFVFLGDRVRRVAYWGMLTGDASGRTDRVRIQGAFIVPGAKRTDTAGGDWRDKGPGLSGFVSSGDRRRAEDLYAIDRGAAGGRLRVHKVNRYGSALGAVRVLHAFDGPLGAEALSYFRGDGFLLRHGDGRGTLSAVAEPAGGATTGMVRLESAPPLPDGQAWTGMCHGPGGTLYLVSDGDPAVLAWRRRR